MSLIAQFEKAIYAESASPKKWDAAIDILHQLVSNFDQAQATTELYYDSRLANGIAALLQNPNYEMTLSHYQLLCASHRSISAVFASTHYQNADFIITRLADISNIKQIKFPNQSVLMKCLLSYSLDSRYEFDLVALSKQLPEVLASLLLGLLSYDLFARQRIQNKFADLLVKDWSALHTVIPTLPMILNISAPWMNCSYAHIENKHAIKPHLNCLIKNAVAQAAWPEQADACIKTEKPVVIVPLEIFHSRHAMFRCFSRAVESLKVHFHVVGVSTEHGIDDQAKQCFDDMILFDPKKTLLDLSAVVQSIINYQPSIIYYPSLGMANYTLLLANKRLAPIQCFGLGHPASSAIDTMDYVVVQEQDFTHEGIYTENIILTANETSPTINLVTKNIPVPGIHRPKDKIRIAVSSKHMKINYRFLYCCQKISEHLIEQGQDVEFYFFPGATGQTWLFMRNEIKRLLPNSEVWPTSDYETYIQRLDECHMRLGTFPFGGANTNMDCFGLGIPFIVMSGEQAHAQSDVAQMQQANMPEWLIVNSEEAYIEAGIRLASNKVERQKISEHMMQLNQHQFFYTQALDKPEGFQKTMSWVYANHESLQQSKQKVWTLADQV